MARPTLKTGEDSRCIDRERERGERTRSLFCTIRKVWKIRTERSFVRMELSTDRGLTCDQCRRTDHGEYGSHKR